MPGGGSSPFGLLWGDWGPFGGPTFPVATIVSPCNCCCIGNCGRCPYSGCYYTVTGLEGFTDGSPGSDCIGTPCQQANVGGITMCPVKGAATMSVPPCNVGNPIVDPNLACTNFYGASDAACLFAGLATGVDPPVYGCLFWTRHPDGVMDIPGEWRIVINTGDVVFLYSCSDEQFKCCGISTFAFEKMESTLPYCNTCDFVPPFLTVESGTCGGRGLSHGACCAGVQLRRQGKGNIGDGLIPAYFATFVLEGDQDIHCAPCFDGLSVPLFWTAGSWADSISANIGSEVMFCQNLPDGFMGKHRIRITFFCGNDGDTGIGQPGDGLEDPSGGTTQWFMVVDIDFPLDPKTRDTNRYIFGASKIQCDPLVLEFPWQNWDTLQTRCKGRVIIS